MSRSFELDSPDHFTAGTVGPPGQRVFYVQARQARTLVTLKSEKEHVRGLGEYLAGLLAKLPDIGLKPTDDRGLLEPVEAAWSVGAIAVGYDEARDRILIVATEAQEEEAEEEPATARFLISRAQAADFARRAEALVKAGRPVCPMCSQSRDPEGHVCPRSNGHVVR